MNSLKKTIFLVVITTMLIACGKDDLSSPPPRSVASDKAKSISPNLTGKELAVNKGCMQCHALDKKLVGPSYQDVSKKYGANDEERLTQKVIKGGNGAWGIIPMPPNPQISLGDARTLVKWILAGAK
jgi:cytochrome c